MNISGEVDNKAEILNSILVDRTYRVVDEATGGQDGKSKNLGIMSSIFVKGTNAFSVNDNDVDLLSFCRGAFQRFSPTPQTLSARIDSGSNTESIASVEKDTV